MGLLDRYRRPSASLVPSGGSEDDDGTQSPGQVGGPNTYAQPAPAAPAAPLPPATPATGNGGNGGGAPAGYAGGSPTFNFPTLPGFTPPQFHAPTLADAMAEPGYQFRSQAGLDAIEGSAAARGVLRTGGTLKDLAAWNSDFASQEYGNVYNRALQGFDRDYRGAYDMFAPKMTEYSLKGNAAIQGELARYNQAWQNYAFHNPQNGGGGGGGGDDTMTEDEFNNTAGGTAGGAI